jgi:formylglycine-generating enzyme
MLGNAWQWCSDWLDAQYYAASNLDDPTGPDSGMVRVLCGGSWYGGPDVTRSANHFGGDPEARFSHGGFRVARTQQ